MQEDKSDEKEALSPQPRKRKIKNKIKKRLRDITVKSFVLFIPFVRLIEEYCINCLNKYDVFAIVHMLETIVPRDGPPQIWASIERIKKYWDKKLHGAKIIREGDIIHGDKNDFRKGSGLNHIPVMEYDQMTKLVEQLKNKQQKYGKKRQNERRSQYVRGRKYDDKVLPE